MPCAAPQRAVELGYKRFVMLTLGTWGVNAYLRALGARIGAFATIRFGNPILAPDMLDLGRGCAFPCLDFVFG